VGINIFPEGIKDSAKIVQKTGFLEGRNGPFFHPEFLTEISFEYFHSFDVL
jgi:hypothetical protein